MALKLPFPADLIVETIREPLLVLSAELRVLQANPSFFRTFQVSSEETHGRVLFDLGNGQWDIPSLRALLDSVIHQNATFDDYEVSHEFPSLGRKIMLLNARRVVGSIEERPVDAILLAIEDVTERRATDRRRQLSEDRFRLLADAVPQMVWIADADGKVEFCNQQWFDYTGVRKLHPTGGDIIDDIVHPDDREATQQAFTEALRSGSTYRVEHRIRSAAGEYRWFLVRGQPHRDPRSGRILNWFGTSTDIHDRRATEDALRESQSRLQAIFEHTEAGIAQVDLEGRFTLVNERYTQIVGRTREQLQHLRMQDITHPDDLPRNVELFRQAVRDGKPFVIEKRYIRPDGSEVWVNNSVSLTRDAEGKPSGVVAAAVDITDRRRAEQTLRESEQHARRIIDNTVAFVGVMTPDGTLTEANETALRAGGIRRDDVIGKKFWDCYWWSYDPDIQSQLKHAIQRAVAGEIVRYDVVVRMTGNTRMPIDFMISPVRDEQGRITHLIPSATDITDRKNAEEALRESEARLRLAVSIAEMGTFQIDLLTDAVHVNDTGRKIYGWAPDLPLSFTIVQSYFHPDDKPMVMKRVGEALRPDGPGEFEVEQRIIRADGMVRWIRVRGRTAFEGVDGDRRAVRCVGTYLDTTDQKEAEQRREALLARERAARAEAERTSRMKDEFLATLSHELRTPLNAILGWSQILTSGPLDEKELAEGVRTIERNARAQTQIIEDLLDMSRIIGGKVRLDVQRIDLAVVIRDAIETVRPSADAKGIRLQTVLDPSAGPVSGDPARLQQVMWNLLSNAVKFTKRGGRVQVLLERVNSHLEVSIIDTGEGISADFLPHVFDRFRQADASTTRRHGGLGLGLSIVKQLVELHGGSVRVKSPGLGQGSTFVVALPLPALHAEPHDDAQRRHPLQTSRSSPTGPDSDCASIAGLKVLVVDDEPDARALIRRLLEKCDAIALTAGSADEAIELLQRERPDVIASDIGMPGEDGYALIRRIRALGADAGGRTPAVALTAYARAEDRVKAMMAGFQTHLAKPVDQNELIATIAAVTRLTGPEPTP